MAKQTAIIKPDKYYRFSNNNKDVFSQKGSIKIQKNHHTARRVLYVTVIYVAFLWVDLFSPIHITVSLALKFAGILLCVNIAAHNLRSAISARDAALLLGALLFTATADVFLLFTRRFMLGIAIFCCAHVLHQLRLCPKLLPVSIVCAATAAFAAAQFLLEPLYCLAAGYAVLLLFSLGSALRCTFARTNKILVIVGMALFILCDTNVAIFNLATPGSFLYRTANVLIWFFYLPSQMLLALSSHRFEPTNLPK